MKKTTLAILAIGLLTVSFKGSAAEGRSTSAIVVGDTVKDCNCVRATPVPTATPVSKEDLMAQKIAALGFKAEWESPGVLLVMLSDLDVNFDVAKTDLKPAAQERIHILVEAMKDFPVKSVAISGHTDSIGTEGSNQKLSLGRAKSVLKEFLSRGVDPAKIEEVQGLAATKPLGDNETKEGRSMNRRVEVRVRMTANP